MTWIESTLRDLPIALSDQTGDRIRMAGACFAAALEHHHAVVVLLRERLNGAAFGLMRGEYEAYVRGVWLARCATDSELSSYISDTKRRNIDQMLQAIEAMPVFDSRTLSLVKAKNWDAMCSYTHTGALQVQRWISSEAIESQHSPEEIEEVLGFTSTFALLAANGVAALAGNISLAGQLLEKSREVASW